MVTGFCMDSSQSLGRRVRFNQRKLEMLKFFKDSLERKIASVNASIEVLEQQINRDDVSASE